MHARRTFVVVLGSLAISLAAFTIAPLAAAEDAAGPGVVNCAGAVVHRPGGIVITCADAGVAITKITWTSWTFEKAKGTGTLVWNTCLPKTCVAGIVQRYKVNITLGGVASAPNEPVFTKVAIGFPRGGPAALETGSYTLDRPIAGQG